MQLLRHVWLVIIGAVALFASLSSGRSWATNPFRRISVVQSPVIHTPSHRVHAWSNFDLTFSLHDDQQRIKLSLVPNHDILANDARVTYVDQSGKAVRSESISRAEHRVFKGSAFVDDGLGHWERIGWARIAIKSDGANTPLFEGAFSSFADHYSVLLKSRYLVTKHRLDPVLDDSITGTDGGSEADEYMVVLRNSDIIDSASGLLPRSEILDDEPACNAHMLKFNADSLRSRGQSPNPKFGAISKKSLFGLLRRQDDIGGGDGGSGDYQKTIGNTDGCPGTKKVALLGVALDCSYTGSFDSSDDARSNVIHVVNTASHAYEHSFNITLGLQNLTVFPKDCPAHAPKSAPFNLPCDANQDIGSRLSLFSQWRGDNQDDNAFWTLMSKCGSGSEVGLSWLGQLCMNTVSSDSSNSVTGANFVVRTSLEWQVFAHEVGHTFGAVHDCDKQTCSDGTSSKNQCCPLSTSSCNADGKYIMNPSTNAKATDFSPCSVGNICSGLGSTSIRTTCLVSNREVPPLNEAQCGNGVVERGEDCDCGGEDGCKDNKCCDPKTCKFTSGSVCDDTNDECCHQCQYASAGTVCRPSVGSCDYAEKCTGKSRACPEDKHHPDGDNCGGGRTCASGQCTSRDDQCRTNMGKMLDGNSTRACDDNSCRIQCNGPYHQGCTSIMQNFIDGTPCQTAGHCKSGNCQTSNAKEVAGWVRQHKGVVIGVCCAAGTLIAIAIASACLQRYQKPKKTLPPMPTGPIPPGVPVPNAVPPAGQVPPPPPPPPPPYPAGPPPPVPPHPTFTPSYARYA